jgi:outer membrane lipase/esterase
MSTRDTMHPGSSCTTQRHCMALWRIAAAIALTGAGLVQSAEFSATEFFGDSLTDSGSFGSKFTTNPGPVWSENVASHFGTTATPNLTTGGSNYAQGGARVNATPGVGITGAQPISVQIDGFLSTNPRLDSRSLFAIWGGANDVLFQYGAFGAGQPLAISQAGVVTAADDLATQISRLHAAGARYILVPNLPDIGATPFGASQPAGGAALLTGFSSLYNTELFTNLAGTGLKVIALDVNSLFKEVLANPASYGFRNATTPACTVASSFSCTSATLVASDAAQTYVFADPVHPTTATHRILSDYAISVIEAPQKIALLAEIPLRLGEANARAVEDHLTAVRDASNRGQPGEGWFVTTDVNPDEIDVTGTSPGIKATNFSLSAGIDKHLSEHVLVGVAAGIGHTRADFSDSGGNFDVDHVLLAAYGSYHPGPYYINAIASYGELSFGSVERNVPLGPATRKESGSTSGRLAMARLSGGYDIDAGNWTLGPIAALTYQRIEVNGYTESSGMSTAMNFSDQVRTSLIGTVGTRVSHPLGLASGMFVPYAQLTYNHDYQGKDREVDARVASMPAGFSMPAYKADPNYGELDLGVYATLNNRMKVSAALSTTLGLRSAESRSLMLALHVPF